MNWVSFVIAALFGLGSWAVGTKSAAQSSFLYSWTGAKGKSLRAVDALIYLAASSIGYFVLDYLKYPGEDVSSPIRGLLMGAFGQGIVRVQFDKVPKLGGGVTLLAQLFERVEELKKLSADRAVIQYVNLLPEKDLINLAVQLGALIGKDSSDPGSAKVRKDLVSDARKMVVLLSLKPGDLDTAVSLRRLCWQAIPQYQVDKRHIK